MCGILLSRLDEEKAAAPPLRATRSPLLQSRTESHPIPVINLDTSDAQEEIASTPSPYIEEPLRQDDVKRSVHSFSVGDKVFSPPIQSTRSVVLHQYSKEIFKHYTSVINFLAGLKLLMMWT
jgi:hypothetical protein